MLQKTFKFSMLFFILFAVFYALVIAVISYYLVRMTSLERSVMLFGFVAPFGLIKILPFIVDTSEFERKNWFGRKTSPVRQGSGSFVADVLRTAAEERVRNARRAQQRVVRRMLCIAASAVIWVANNY